MATDQSGGLAPARDSEALQQRTIESRVELAPDLSPPDHLVGPRADDLVVIQIDDGHFTAGRYSQPSGAVRLLLKTRGIDGAYGFSLDGVVLHRELPASGSVEIPCGPLSEGEHVMRVGSAQGQGSTAILEVADARQPTH